MNQIEYAAWADLFGASGARVQGVLGLDAVEARGAHLLRARGVDHMLLNRCFVHDPQLPDSRAVEDLLRFYEDVPRLFVQTFAAPVAPGLEVLLSNFGLERYHRPWIKLVAELDDTPREAVTALPREDGCTFRAAVPGDAPRLCALFAQGFGLPLYAAALFAGAIDRPAWQVMIAERQGEIAAAGLLYYEQEWAYLAGGVTDPVHRGRGLQRALIRRRLERARALGVRYVSSETGAAVAGEPNSSYNNMCREGLVPVATVLNYVRRGTHWRGTVSR